MSEKVNLKQLAAKLIGASRVSPKCWRCLDAGYIWTQLDSYLMPIQCYCKANNRQLILYERADKVSAKVGNASGEQGLANAQVSQQDGKPIAIEYLLSEVIPKGEDCTALSSEIAKTIARRDAKDSIARHKVNEDNIETALFLARRSYMEYEFDSPTHEELISLLREGGQ